MKSSRDVVRAGENSLFETPSTVAIMASCFEIAPEVIMQSCNQLERGSVHVIKLMRLFNNMRAAELKMHHAKIM